MASWTTIMREGRSRFGISELRPGQEKLMRAVFSGRDALGVLPTGAGKSLCYQLPAVFLNGATLVVSPLLALMKDQTDALAEREVAVAKVDSTLTADEERDVVESIVAGEPALIYVTPERIQHPDYVELLSKRGVSLVVIDEAHCVSQWGHDFRPAYLDLRNAIAALDSPPILALTATATPDVAKDIIRQLRMREPEIVRVGVARENIRLEVRRTVNGDAKTAALRQLLLEETGPTIIYTATTRKTDELHASLARDGHKVGRYHGKLATREREDSQSRFMEGELRIMVATKAFGMGIDKRDLRLVVHWNLPDSLESYVQEAGRAGRDGKPAKAVLLYRVEDKRIQSYFLGGKYPRRAESLRCYEALASGDDATADAIATFADLSLRRATVVLALLELIGVVTRTRGRFRLLRRFDSPNELEEFLGEYESRHRDDHERLEQMIRYGQTTSCRGVIIQRYFGERVDEICGRCDNCESGIAAVATAAQQSHRHARANRPLVAAFSVEPGEQVLHGTFGRGEVRRVDGQSVTVAFDGGEQVVRASWLSSAPRERTQGP
ncbi:MAG: ATP-dependent DNA helicase RecQ [Kofleriaceae bacterium]